MSYENWRTGKEVASETSRTFSGFLFDYCRSRDARALVLSSHPRRARIRDGAITVENRPKPDAAGLGLRYHRSQLAYGLGIVREALRFNADVVVADSGTTHWFALSLLKPFGIRIIASMHNAIWPKGYFPAGRAKRAILALDGLFWRHVAAATVAVSPELGRQATQLSGGRPRGPIVQMRGIYRRELMGEIPPPPAADARPFRIMFAGRIERNKGVLDVVEIADRIRVKHPGAVVWEMCGDGGALAELKEMVVQRRIEDTVRVLGRLNRFDMAQCYGRANAVIVPTRSDFCEGLPMVVIEGVLTGRPVITSRLSNALDVLGAAILEARPDDVDSYVAAVERLLTDPGLYTRLRDAGLPLQEQFYDPANSFCSALARAIPRAG